MRCALLFTRPKWEIGLDELHELFSHVYNDLVFSTPLNVLGMYYFSLSRLEKLGKYFYLNFNRALQ